MDIRVLRYFLAVVETGSLSRAAGLVAVAQPSLSRQIRGLERELRVELFKRAQGRLVLTAAGKRFVPIASDLVARFNDSVQVMRELGDLGPSCLAVAANVTTLSEIIAPFAASLGTTLTLDLKSAPTVELPSIVKAGDADLALSALPGASSLTSELVARFPLFACVPQHHRWSERKEIELVELLDERLLVLNPDSVARRLLDDAVGRLGRPYSPTFEAELAATAQAMAAAGNGVAILTDLPRFGLRRIRIRDGSGTLLTLPLFAVWDGSHYASERIRGLVAELRSFCHQVVEDAILDQPG